jgi:hypothetical protein
VIVVFSMEVLFAVEGTRQMAIIIVVSQHVNSHMF